MIRFKPKPSSSARIAVFTVGREVWNWPCACVVDSNLESMTLVPCWRDDCVRDAETPWTPPATGERGFECKDCGWVGFLSECGTWIPAGGGEEESEDACPVCRSEIVPRFTPAPDLIRSREQPQAWGVPCDYCKAHGITDPVARQQIPVLCVGEHTINLLRAGQHVDLDVATLIPASDLKRDPEQEPETIGQEPETIEQVMIERDSWRRWCIASEQRAADANRERRERIAVEMMKAHLIAMLQATPDAMPNAFASDAVRSTDALIAALEKNNALEEKP